MTSHVHNQPNQSNPNLHPTFRSAYFKHQRQKQDFSAGGRTKQAFKDECDINQIMARYLATGVLDHARDVGARYADVTTLDYQEAQNLIAEAASAFASLPSALRGQFDNDPAVLLDWVHDPANLDEAVELGFIDRSRVKIKPAKEAAPTSAPSGGAAATPSKPEPISKT